MRFDHSQAADLSVREVCPQLKIPKEPQNQGM